MNRYLMRRYQLSKEGAGRMIKAIVFTAAFNLVQMAPVVMMATFIQKVVEIELTGEDGEYSAWIYIIAALAVGALILFVSRLQYDSLYTKVYSETAKTRIKLAETLRRLPLSFFAQRDLSDLTSTILGDVATLEHGYSHAVPQLYGSIASISIVTIMIAIFSPIYALALIWPFPIVLLLLALVRNKKYKAGVEHHAKKLVVTEKIQEILENISAIKSYSAGERIYDELDGMIEVEEKAHIKSELPNAYIIASLTSLLRLGSATSILAGMYLYMNDALEIYEYIVMIIASLVIYLPMDACLAFILELIHIDVPISRMQDIYDSKILEGDDVELKSFDIEFENVDFSYSKGESVLKNVTFTAKQGEVTALVGASGCGKSTVTKLMLRFWDPDGGRVQVGNKDIKGIEPESLLKNYSMVFQDVILFNRSIKENIRVGRKDATDAEVVEAAKVAQIHEFVESLPQGYETIIGENGALLSGGERQRLSIARAVLKDAPIILLDESTASIDAESESAFQKALAQLIKNKTVVVIAHRLRTVEKADKIVVLKEGEVVEQGRPQELIEQRGLFYDMWKIQKGGDVGSF